MLCMTWKKKQFLKGMASILKHGDDIADIDEVASKVKTTRKGIMHHAWPLADAGLIYIHPRSWELGDPFDKDSESGYPGFSFTEIGEELVRCLQ